MIRIVIHMRRGQSQAALRKIIVSILLESNTSTGCGLFRGPWAWPLIGFSEIR